jgi:formylglycine-generating enzyme required for sulfatase activity
VNSFEEGKSPYGIYNLSGNVEEYCLDWFDDKYYKNSPEKNPSGPSEEPKYFVRKTLRGGSLMTNMGFRKNIVYQKTVRTS